MNFLKILTQFKIPIIQNNGNKKEKKTNNNL